jgi:hypothetical protein
MALVAREVLVDQKIEVDMVRVNLMVTKRHRILVAVHEVILAFATLRIEVVRTSLWMLRGMAIYKMIVIVAVPDMEDRHLSKTGAKHTRVVSFLDPKKTRRRFAVSFHRNHGVIRSVVEGVGVGVGVVGAHALAIVIGEVVSKPSHPLGDGVEATDPIIEEMKIVRKMSLKLEGHLRWVEDVVEAPTSTFQLG